MPTASSLPPAPRPPSPSSPRRTSPSPSQTQPPCLALEDGQVMEEERRWRREPAQVGRGEVARGSEGSGGGAWRAPRGGGGGKAAGPTEAAELRKGSTFFFSFLAGANCQDAKHETANLLICFQFMNTCVGCNVNVIFDCISNESHASSSAFYKHTSNL